MADIVKNDYGHFRRPKLRIGRVDDAVPTRQRNRNSRSVRKSNHGKAKMPVPAAGLAETIQEIRKNRKLDKAVETAKHCEDEKESLKALVKVPRKCWMELVEIAKDAECEAVAFGAAKKIRNCDFYHIVHAKDEIGRRFPRVAEYIRERDGKSYADANKVALTIDAAKEKAILAKAREDAVKILHAIPKDPAYEGVFVNIGIEAIMPGVAQYAAENIYGVRNLKKLRKNLEKPGFEDVAAFVGRKISNINKARSGNSGLVEDILP